MNKNEQVIAQMVVSGAMSNRLPFLLKLLEASPGDAFTLFALAKEYEGLGDNDKAVQYYRQLHDQDAGYVGMYYHLGRLYERLSRSEEALAVYREGLDVAKKAGDRHAYSELYGAFLEAGGEDEDEDL